MDAKKSRSRLGLWITILAALAIALGVATPAVAELGSGLFPASDEVAGVAEGSPYEAAEASFEVGTSIEGWPDAEVDTLTFPISVKVTASGGAGADGVTFAPALDEGVSITLNKPDGAMSVTSDMESVAATFSQPGTYTFTFTQNAPTVSPDTADISNIALDSRILTLVANVTIASGDGEQTDSANALSVQWQGVSDPANPAVMFDNLVSASATPLGISVSKEFTDTSDIPGWEWTSDHAFDFAVTPINQAAQDASSVYKITEYWNASKPTIDAADMTLTWSVLPRLTPKSELVYELTEVIPGGESSDQAIDGVTYNANGSTAAYTIAVNLNSANGRWASRLYSCDAQTYLDATENGMDASGAEAYRVWDNLAMFVNTYAVDPGSATLDVTKAIAGRNFVSADAFEFTLEPKGSSNASGDPTAAPMPVGTDAGTALTKELTYSEAVGTNSYTQAFCEIPFSPKDIGTTFYYTMSEVDPGDSETTGMTTSSTVHNISITPRDNGDGTMGFDIDSDGAPTAAFTNNFEVVPATLNGNDAGDANRGVLEVQKTLSGRDWNTTDSFSFTIANTKAPAWPEDGDAEHSGSTYVIDSPTITLTANSPTAGDTADAATRASSFGKLSFLTEGEYVFSITEDVPADAQDGKLNGVTYATTEYVLTVDVVYNDGQNLEVGSATLSDSSGAAVDAAGPMTFTNTYNAAPAQLTYDDLLIDKSIAGRTWNDDDSFTFSIVAVDQNPSTIQGLPSSITIDANSAVDPNASADAVVRSASFAGNDATSTLSVNETGRYSFTITEDGTGGSGFTYDSDPRTLSFEVDDNGNGRLVVSGLTMTGGDPATGGSGNMFVNTYSATGTAYIDLTKVMDGRMFQSSDVFSFTLSSTGSTAPEAPMPIGSADGSFTATLDCGIAAGQDTYTSNGSFAIPLTLEDAGKTFEYQITEASSGLPGGVTADKSTVTVTIGVEDNGNGTLATDVSYSKNGKPAASAEFINSYESFVALKDAFTIKKTVVNEADEPYPIPGGAIFEFDVVDTTAYAPGFDSKHAKLPSEAPSISLGETQSSGTTVIEGIEFSKAGEYTFTVSEKTGKLEKVDYTHDSYTITVVVAENPNGADGTLQVSSVSVMGPDGEELDGGAAGSDPAAYELSFTNTYAPNAAIYALTIQKTLSGRIMYPSDGFTFDVKATPKAIGATVMEKTATVTINGDGESNTASTVATLALGGVSEWTIEVTEREPADGTNISGPKEMTQSFDITLESDGTSYVVPGVAQTLVEFANKYSVTQTSELKLTKALTGRALADGDAFTFRLTAVSPDAPMPQGVVDGQSAYSNTLTYSGTGDDEYSFTGTFASIPFDETDIGHRYTYSIRETAPGADTPTNGVTGTEDAVFATVLVSFDPTSNGLAFAWTFTSGPVLSFTNSYSATGSYAIDVQKSLTGRDFIDGDIFSFNVVDSTDYTAADAPAAPATISGNKTVSADEASANPITNTVANIGFAAPGTYAFAIWESPATAPGVSKDPTQYTLTLVVTDDGKGNLTVDTASSAVASTGETTTTTPTVGEGSITLPFTNTYTPDAAILSVPVTKVMTGRPFMTSDEFTFTLEATGTGDAAGAVTPASTTLDIRGTGTDRNTAESQLTFTKAGTYTITVSEDSTTKIPGVDYQTETQTIDVVVEDDATTGKLTATPTYPDGASEVTFTNAFAADGSAQIDVAKEIVGRDFVDGDRFTFTVTPQGDAPSATLENEGMVSFLSGGTNPSASNPLATIALTEEDIDHTYTYVITETDSDMPGFDASMNQTVTANVTVGVDVATGDLTTKVTYSSGGSAALFTNIYVAAPATLTGNDSLWVKKILSPWPEDESFVFDIELTDGNAECVELPGSLELTSGAQAAAFGDVAFKQQGTYALTVTEQEPRSSIISGSNQSYTIQVTVGDDPANATLSASITDPTGGYPETGPMEFTNTFIAPSEFGQLSILKTIGEGVDPATEFKFTVTLTSPYFQGGLTYAGDVTATVTAASDGSDPDTGDEPESDPDDPGEPDSGDTPDVPAGNGSTEPETGGLTPADGEASDDPADQDEPSAFGDLLDTFFGTEEAYAEGMDGSTVMLSDESGGFVVTASPMTGNAIMPFALGSQNVTLSPSTHQVIVTASLSNQQTLMISNIPAGTTYSITQTWPDGTVTSTQGGTEGTILSGENGVVSNTRKAEPTNPPAGPGSTTKPGSGNGDGSDDEKGAPEDGDLSPTGDDFGAWALVAMIAIVLSAGAISTFVVRRKREA